MAEQSLALSALNKLEGINEQLTDLYKSVDAIKQLESGFSSLYNNKERQHQELLDRYETNLVDCEQIIKNLSQDFVDELVVLDERKESLNLAIQQLSQQKEDLNNTIQYLLSSYEIKQEQINSAISQLTTQQIDLESLEASLIKHLLAWITALPQNWLIMKVVSSME